MPTTGTGYRQQTLQRDSHLAASRDDRPPLIFLLFFFLSINVLRPLIHALNDFRIPIRIR
jgi:hypothetical protein